MLFTRKLVCNHKPIKSITLNNSLKDLVTHWVVFSFDRPQLAEQEYNVKRCKCPKTAANRARKVYGKDKVVVVGLGVHFETKPVFIGSISTKSVKNNIEGFTDNQLKEGALVEFSNEEYHLERGEYNISSGEAYYQLWFNCKLIASYKTFKGLANRYATLKSDHKLTLAKDCANPQY